MKKKLTDYPILTKGCSSTDYLRKVECHLFLTPPSIEPITKQKNQCFETSYLQKKSKYTKYCWELNVKNIHV